MDPLSILEAHANDLKALGARKIGIFGSFAKGRASQKSAVDVYLEFEEGGKTTIIFSKSTIFSNSFLTGQSIL